MAKTQEDIQVHNHP